MILVIVLKMWFFAATWALTCELIDRRAAFLSTVIVMGNRGSYGGYSVFKFSEDWLTARTLAEPMVITAVWLYCRNFRSAAFLLTFAAFFVHPLMTLPALALILLLSLPLTVGAAGAVLGVTAALGTALLALHNAKPGPIVHNGCRLALHSWSDRVFLFPQIWPAADWEINALPFFSLAISAMVPATQESQNSPSLWRWSVLLARR